VIPHAEIPVERVRALAADPDFLTAMRAFYDRLEAEIAKHRPVCRNRGDCCRFGEFGHRLYVTPLELAFFVGSLEQTRDVPGGATACPYQVDGLCGARVSRPLGCRVFFCESAGKGWQEQLTESALGELRRMHQQFDVPYAYVEWLGALAEIRKKGHRSAGALHGCGDGVDACVDGRANG
jgi:hypothetical protein